MMMHNPILKIVCLISWFITAIVCLHIGLQAFFNFDITQYPFFYDNFGSLIQPLKYVIGVAGAWSLVSLALTVFGMGCSCCEKNERRPYSGM
jgi:hypothetical protein